nr:MAG TPA: Nuclease [Caudoviricetes sp.]
MVESKFQSILIKELKERFKGCVVVKNDANYMQGIPDLTIYYGNRWAMLETKRSEDAPHRPNQDYYVSLFDSMSYAAFIFPENKEVILNEMEQTFQP